MKDTYHRDGRLIQETVSVGNTEAYTLLYLYTGGTLTGLVYLGANGTKIQYMLEHDLAGNVVAILNAQRVPVATYAYDAFGNHAVYDGEGNVNTDEDFIGNLNPFRYKGYYYDADTGLYNLNAREYDPYYGRFISPDSLRYQDPYTPAGLGLYAYCNGDPVNYADPSGCAPKWLRNVLDIGLYVLSASLAITTGITTATTSGPVAGIVSGLHTFGMINNVINAVYYNFISDGESSLTLDSYVHGYVNRWDRLDYTKEMTQERWYNLNAWRYFSEYNFHMWTWYSIGWTKDLNIPRISGYAGSAESAWVEEHSWEIDGKTGKFSLRNIFYIIVGLLGL